MRRALKYLAAGLVALGVAVAAVAVAFPELILTVFTLSARRTAGLERRTLEVAGDRFVYLDGGSGPWVVLFHGFGANKDMWNGLAARLTPSYRVVAPDIPGFGESPAKPSERYDPATQAARLRSFLHRIGADVHHLAGLSMGGEIAAVYASSFPDAVRSLAVMAAPGVRSPESTDFVRSAMAGGHPLEVEDEAGFDALSRLVYYRPPSVPALLKRPIIRRMRARQETDRRIFADIVGAGEDALEPLLPRIRARTLILWGTEDRLVHPSAAGVYAASIAGSEVALLPECGHDLPGECGPQVADRYLAFLGAAP